MSEKILVVAGEEWNDSYMNSVRFLNLDVTESIRDFYSQPGAYRLVLFTGGADVSPEIYGHAKSKHTYNAPMRDYHERELFLTAVESGIPMAGICRGVQFLNCMYGGFMIQHVDHHAMGGGCSHEVTTFEGTNLKVNSLHHQMIVPPIDAYVLAVSKTQRSQRYIYDGNKKFKNPIEVESVYFPAINSFGVQWHPEAYNCPKDGIDYFERNIYNLVNGLLNEKVSDLKPPTMGAIFDSGWESVKYKKRYRYFMDRSRNEESISVQPS